MRTVKPNPELIDDENPEWTEEMFATAVRVHDLPAGLRDKLISLNKGGRPVAENPKVSTTIRFDADVIAFFKASGKGWQTRMNQVLRDYVASH